MADLDKFVELAKEDAADKIKHLFSENPGLFQFSDQMGQTVLHYAAGIGGPKTTEWLLSQQNTPKDAIDTNGRSPFHIAALNGCISVIDVLLHDKTIDLHAHDHEGFTALHLATRAGKSEVCKQLVEVETTDVNARDDEGKTALHHAVIFNQLGIAELLITKTRIETDARDDFGETAFDKVAKSGTPEMCEVFIKDRKACAVRHDGYTPIHTASYYGNIDFLWKFVCPGNEDFYAIDCNGRTPLDEAFLGDSMKKDKVLDLFIQIYVMDGKYKECFDRCKQYGDFGRAQSCLELYCIESRTNAIEALGSSQLHRMSEESRGDEEFIMLSSQGRGYLTLQG